MIVKNNDIKNMNGTSHKLSLENLIMYKKNRFLNHVRLCDKIEIVDCLQSPYY